MNGLDAEQEARVALRSSHRWVCSGPEDDEPWCGDCGLPMFVFDEGEPRGCPGPHGERSGQ